MTIFKIPRVCVYIPGETSRVKFVPEYEYPLFQYVYRGRIADPAGDPLRLIPHPKGSGYAEYWYEVEAEDENELATIEAMRLRRHEQEGGFGNARSGDTVLDTVFPADAFNAAVRKALASAETHMSDPLRADPVDNIIGICEKASVDRAIARKLVQIGWTDAELLAAADIEQLAKYAGKVRAAKLIKAAEDHINVLINATPEEQIEGAKKAAKKG